MYLSPSRGVAASSKYNVYYNYREALLASGTEKAGIQLIQVLKMILNLNLKTKAGGGDIFVYFFMTVG